jgi:LacI family transcriptional regulator
MKEGFFRSDASSARASAIGRKIRNDRFEINRGYTSRTERPELPAKFSVNVRDMNIAEVARRANVSTATVSRALNGVTTVDPTLARRVRRAVAELGYVPNGQARALVRGRSNLLALIVPEITNPFFPEVVQTFESVAANNGYETLLTTIEGDPKRIEAAVRRMLARRVDGIAILTFGLEDLLLEHLQITVPLVFVDVTNQVGGTNNIRVDYLQGIRQAVEHLTALRHRKIAFAIRARELYSAGGRKAAFEIAVSELGLRPSAITMLIGDYNINGGAEVLNTLLALPERPTALLCCSDMMAIGVIREAEGRLSIPSDSIPSELSVVGFDDIPLARFTTPLLTTVRMCQSALARLVFDALFEALERTTHQCQRCNYLLNT